MPPRVAYQSKLSKLIVSKIDDGDGKAPRFRGRGNLRKSRGIAFICSSFDRTGAVQGHGVEGGEPAGRAARRPAVQPHLAAAGADRRRAKARRTRRAAVE